jgi:hypothetical protein
MGKIVSRKQNEEELYRLWIEYLKRSEKYKQFCSILADKKKDLSISIPYEYKGTHWISLYSIFGPIHSDIWNFPEWWKIHQERLKGGIVFVEDAVTRKIFKMPELDREYPVQEYADFIPRHIDICVSRFKFHNDNDPTIEQLKEQFVEELKTGMLSNRVILQIDPQGLPTESLLNEIRKLLKHKRKTSKGVAFREIKAQAYLRTTSERPNLAALKRYLEVYDLKMNGLKCSEIIDVIKKKRKLDKLYDKADLIRECEYQCQCATQIIENIEQDLVLGFPGPHGKTKRVRGIAFPRTEK